jgi:hypothetical protein
MLKKFGECSQTKTILIYKMKPAQPTLRPFVYGILLNRSRDSLSSTPGPCSDHSELINPGEHNVAIYTT